VKALTDGVLVLRYLFYFRGDTLTKDAVQKPGCTRCMAAEIEAYLLALFPQLDIDGDGERDPLTDGLLVLRYMFGFPGDTLVAGATDTDCTRCTASEVEAYLEGLLY
jgi:hypothetical protein